MSDETKIIFFFFMSAETVHMCVRLQVWLSLINQFWSLLIFIYLFRIVLTISCWWFDEMEQYINKWKKTNKAECNNEKCKYYLLIPCVSAEIERKWPRQDRREHVFHITDGLRTRMKMISRSAVTVAHGSLDPRLCNTNESGVQIAGRVE